MSYEIIKIIPLQNETLVNYLHAIGIHFKYANKYCKEIHYKNSKNKELFGIGFPSKGNWIICNKIEELHFGEPVSTLFSNSQSELHVFNHFFDFLSYFTLYQNNYNTDYLILHKNKLTNDLLDRMNEYKKVSLFFDHKYGPKLNYIITNNAFNEIEDKSSIYVDHESLNGYVQYKMKISKYRQNEIKL